jgi:hypothetical protein
MKLTNNDFTNICESIIAWCLTNQKYLVEIQ